MQTPILFQHTLAYLFSARPSDRSAYFKALLEVADLDGTRQEIQTAIRDFPAPIYALQPGLDQLKKLPSVLDILNTHFEGKPNVARVQRGLDHAADALLQGDEHCLRGETTTAIEALRGTLDERQRSVFPVALLVVPSLAENSPVSGDTRSVDDLRAADSALEKEIEELGTLYRELLRIHPAEYASEPLDCPACGTSSALTRDRLKDLERRLRETESYHGTLTRARSWVQQTRRAIGAEMSSIRALGFFPLAKERKRHAFGTHEMLTILGTEQRPVIGEWVKTIRRAGTARRHALGILSALAAALPDELGLVGAKLDDFRAQFARFVQGRARLVEVLRMVEAAVLSLKSELEKLVSQKTSTVGWKEVLELHADAVRLSDYLCNKCAHDTLARDHERALKDFDAARDDLLSGKFGALSDEMKKWWDFLRPESFATFESVGMRAKTSRTVDFKVALYPDEAQSTKTLRDAIAVFSGSQLHCLGVAAFLARSVRDGGGFVVLDDPVLSSDHEHRAGFVHTVIDELVKAKLQVILLTQEQRLRDDTGIRYEHLKPDLFRIEMYVPAEGTMVTKTSDGIAEKLARIKTLLAGSDEATRKEAAGELRDVAERFCKEVLVRHFGPPMTLTDFDGRVLAGLIDALEKEKLFKAPDHKGKIALLKRWTNPGNHDAPVPSNAELKSVYGDIKKLATNYLG